MIDYLSSLVEVFCLIVAYLIICKFSIYWYLHGTLMSTATVIGTAPPVMLHLYNIFQVSILPCSCWPRPLGDLAVADRDGGQHEHHQPGQWDTKRRGATIRSACCHQTAGRGRWYVPCIFISQIYSIKTRWIV